MNGTLLAGVEKPRKTDTDVQELLNVTKSNDTRPSLRRQEVQNVLR